MNTSVKWCLSPFAVNSDWGDDDMPKQTLNQVKKALASLLLLAPLTLWAAGSANVDFAVGEVFAVNPVSGQRPLNKGAAIVSGETVRTGNGGRAQLRFDDGAMISLQPNTEFRLDNYQYAGKQDGNERGFFSLIKGGLRTITGLVGRLNKGNYKVTTSVATIGIRGTEYTLTYLDSETIAIGTGEGAIEVCNGGGCTVLGSGDSAVVSGQNGSVQRVDFRPLLEPAQPVGLLLPDFSTGDFRNTGGAVQINGNVLQPGGGYALAYTYASNPPLGGVTTNLTTQFDGSGQLLSASNTVGASYQNTTLAESYALDGVIGWGRWATAQEVTPPASVPTNRTNLYYVVGQPTPASALTTLGTTATYQLVGYATPSGVTPTGALTGSLTANFTGLGTMTVNMTLNIPTVSAVVAINATTGTNPFAVASTFNWDATTGVNGGGMFTGVNASNAGATYNNGTISGSAAFRR
jgi:hypothetical protein